MTDYLKPEEIELSDLDPVLFSELADTDLLVAHQAAATTRDKLKKITKSEVTAFIQSLAPLIHAASHKAGGSDEILLDELGTPTDVTTNNATTSAHGLLPKLSNAVTEFLDGVGSFSVPDHGSIGGLGDDDHTQYPLISTTAGTPLGAPSRVGLINIDTNNDTPYIAVATSSAADWFNLTTGIIGLTASVAELNILNGATLSTTELNYVDGVTSPIQAQLDALGTGNVDTSGTPVANDIARFTDADTIEGRSYAELKADLSLENVDNTDDASKPISTLQAAENALRPQYGELAEITLSSARNLAFSDFGSVIKADMSGGAYALTIPASLQTERWVQIELSDATNALTITAGGGVTLTGTNTLSTLGKTITLYHTSTADEYIVYGNEPVQLFTEKHATSHTLTAAECYGAVYYITASGVTLTLPAVAEGMSLTVICTTANVGIVDANASDLIILDGTALDDGDSIDSTGAAGDIVVLSYYDATGWYATSNGWVDGGAT